jgi:hypothetical protein
MMGRKKSSGFGLWWLTDGGCCGLRGDGELGMALVKGSMAW